jgi:hypothetical protein
MELPKRVICVGDASTNPYLHESAPGEKGMWAALSYSWGKDKTLLTTIDTLSERKTGFALDTMPKTCRDAVLFARALSIPYIWIDRLCIIQDSPDDWKREATRMSYIYENSRITFAGLDSPTGDTGLFLLSDLRCTVKLDTCINGQAAAIYARRQHDIGILSFMHGHFQDTNRRYRGSGYLETRGWTLQEILLSPRILWFSSSEMGWSCWSNTACECDPEQTSEFINSNPDYMKISSSPLLDKTDATDWLATWRALVNEFTTRDLGRQSDRLPAVAGLASALKTHINSAYLAGLWESDIAKQLLWASSSDTISPAMLDRPLKDEHAPSWSWASVYGAVRFVLEAQQPRFSLIWKVLPVQLPHLDLKPFGQGKGSITIEGHLLPVRWVNETLVWVPPANDKDGIEPVLFCSDDEFLMDLRVENRDREVMAQKRFSFLVAGLLMRSAKSADLDVPLLCNGLVLEALPGGGTFRRVGFAEPHFDEQGTKGGWAVWEKRCKTEKIDIV